MRFRPRRRPRRARPWALAGGGLDLGTATAVGRRADNQDRCVAAPGLAVVSDGMGGHQGGARAAQLAVDAVVATLAPPLGDDDPRRSLQLAFAAANEAVRSARAVDARLAEMGATLTVALATSASTEASRWLIGHVGDSPAFVVGAGSTTRVTTDHTGSAALVAAGALTEAQAATHPGRHLLLRAIGPDPAVEVDVAEVVLPAGDALVIGSDGLSGTLDPSEIGTIVRAAGSAASAASTLVATAVERGASDNVTAVVVRQVPSSAA